MLIFFILMCGAVLKNLNVELKQLKNLKNHILIGIHISEGTNLPSGEKISDIKDIIDDQLLGIMLSCVSPENYEKNLKKLRI